MNIKQMAHIGMNVKDMEKSMHFYKDCLGFQPKFTLYLDAEKTKPWIEYLVFGDNQFIELFYTYDELQAHPDLQACYSMHHLALVVEDIHETAKELAEKGIQITSGPDLGVEKTWQLWVKDPDGNPIEFMQYTDKSFQLVGEN